MQVLTGLATGHQVPATGQQVLVDAGRSARAGDDPTA